MMSLLTFSLLYCMIDSMLMWVTEDVKMCLTARVPQFLLSPHIDVICDLLLSDARQHGMYLLTVN